MYQAHSPQSRVQPGECGHLRTAPSPTPGSHPHHQPFTSLPHPTSGQERQDLVLGKKKHPQGLEPCAFVNKAETRQMRPLLECDAFGTFFEDVLWLDT